ncbi:type II secretion system F family protein [Altererythrobacter sp. MF3-039]|uniref:type II secretion system F family protein n=1 Tax=Altererythrobacter sp. MF3-039 TaxID=3252901 RepID=UPI00390C7552
MLEFFANNDVARLAFLALVFALAMGIAAFGISRVNQRAVVRSELKELSGSGAMAQRERLTEQKDSAWSKVADRIEKSGLNLADTQGDKLRNKLIAAGFPSPAAPRIFTLVRFVSVIALPAIYFLIASLSNTKQTTPQIMLWGLLLGVVGLYFPNLLVTARADRRREEIINGFPDCLDLLLVCVEAGLGLEAALDRVGREMVGSHPLVAQLLSQATLQMRAGAAREDALRQMGQSSGVDEIKSFATLLIQSDRLGTSVAQTLRVYSSEMREKRRMRAEEKAHRLPVLISIPLVVCMLPTMIGVLMLPAVVRTIRVLIPAFGGGG